MYPFDDALKAAAAQGKIDPKKWNIPPSVDNGYGGQTWGLDLFVTQDNTVFVNTEMAEKDGLLKDLPLWGTPSFDTWKWPQFVDFLQAATKTLRSGKVIQYAIGTGAGYPLVEALFQPTLPSFGGAWLMNNPWDYNETKSLFDTEPVIETVQMIADLYTRYKVAAPLGVDLATPTFTTEKALMTVWFATPSIAGNFPMSYMHLPYVDQRVHAAGSNSLNVNKAFSDPDEAVEWILTFTTNTEVRKKFLEVSSVPSYDPLPIVKAAPDSPGKTVALIDLSRYSRSLEHPITYRRRGALALLVRQVRPKPNTGCIDVGPPASNTRKGYGERSLQGNGVAAQRGHFRGTCCRGRVARPHNYRGPPPRLKGRSRPQGARGLDWQTMAAVTCGDSCRRIGGVFGGP